MKKFISKWSNWWILSPRRQQLDEAFKKELEELIRREVALRPAIAVEPVLTPVFVYEFLYNSDCCDSAASTISIHKTKKGAEMAMEFHKNEKLKEWEKECKEYPPAKEYPFDFDQWWGVRECELLP